MRAAPKLAKSVSSMSAAQPILAHDGRRQFALPASDAWRRLQALHRGALLETRQGDAGIAPRRAQDAYAKSLGSVLGQFATSHPALRDSIFESLLDHIDASGSIDGLESIYASGLTDVARRNKRLFERASRTRKSVSWPRIAGGGLEHGIHVDPDREIVSKLFGSDLGPVIIQKKWNAPNGPRTGPQVTVAGRQFSGVSGGGNPTQIGGFGDVTDFGGTPDPSDFGVPDLHGTLGPILGDVGSDAPDRNHPDPSGSAVGDNPGERGFHLQFPGEESPTASDFASFGGRFGPLSQNPGERSFRLHMPTGSTGLSGASGYAVSAMGKLASKDATWFDTHGHGFGPHGSGHIALPGGRGPGSEGDDSAGRGGSGSTTTTTQTGKDGKQTRTTTTTNASGKVTSKLTTTDDGLAPVAGPTKTGIDGAKEDFASAQALLSATEHARSREGQPELSATEKLSLLFSTFQALQASRAAGAPKTFGGWAPAPGPPVSGGGSLVGPDEGEGSGSGGPKAYGYMPADDFGSSPINPHSRGAFGESEEPAPTFASVERTPAPDDPTGGGSPRSRRKQGFSGDFMPAPDSNSPGTPHARFS